MINLNEYVTYELTDAGLKKFHELSIVEQKEFNLNKPRTIEEFSTLNGSIRMTLHEFSYFWGRSLFVGSPCYIKDNILKIDEKA